MANEKELRNKLKPLAGEKWKIKFLYDRPKIGTSEYGKYYQYAFSAGKKGMTAAEEFVWFVPKSVHNLFVDQGFKRGKVLIMDVTQELGYNDKPYNVYKFSDETGLNVSSADYPNFVEDDDTPDNNSNTEKRSFMDAVNMMDTCFEKALLIIAKHTTTELKPNYEDLRAVALSLYIDGSRSGFAVEKTADKTDDFPPPPGDDTAPPDDDDSGLPF